MPQTSKIFAGLHVYVSSFYPGGHCFSTSVRGFTDRLFVVIVQDEIVRKIRLNGGKISVRPHNATHWVWINLDGRRSAEEAGSPPGRVKISRGWINECVAKQGKPNELSRLR